MPEIARDTSKLKWYQGLERYCWIVLVISALGWLFDTMDQNLFTMVRNSSLTDILRPLHPIDKLPPDVTAKITASVTADFLKSHNKVVVEAGDKGQLDRSVTKALEKEAGLNADVDSKSGMITAIFLIGWASGGFVFGILGDRIGRTRTMILTILIYAVFTGLSGLVHSFWLYSFTRFMTGLGVGGEWAAGAALVAETFPARSRPMALGLLQALSTVGNIMAAVVTYIIGDLDFNRWRWAYAVGAVPALLVLWIRKSVKEPAAWTAAKEQKQPGKKLGSMKDLFTHPVLRRNTITATLMATAGVGALWGVAFFTPDAVRGELQRTGMSPDLITKKASLVFMVQQVGAFAGIYLFAMFAERFTRKSAFFIWFILSWGSILLFFWGLKGTGADAYARAMLLAPILGFCTLGPFSGYSIYFPELYPTRLRATGCGFSYNIARYLAAFAPFVLGTLKNSLGGYAEAASVVSFVILLGFVGLWIGPETKDRPLPEDADFDVALPDGALAIAK